MGHSVVGCHDRYIDDQPTLKRILHFRGRRDHGVGLLDRAAEEPQAQSPVRERLAAQRLPAREQHRSVGHPAPGKRSQRVSGREAVCHVITSDQERCDGKRHRCEGRCKAASAKQGISNSKRTRIRAQDMRRDLPLAQAIRELADLALRIPGTGRIDPGKQERGTERRAVSRRHRRMVW